MAGADLEILKALTKFGVHAIGLVVRDSFKDPHKLAEALLAKGLPSGVPNPAAVTAKLQSYVDNFAEEADNSTEAYQELAKKVEKLTKQITKDTKASLKDLELDSSPDFADLFAAEPPPPPDTSTKPKFTTATATTIAHRMARVLIAGDEATSIIATAAARTATDAPDSAAADQLRHHWGPWVKSFQDAGSRITTVLNSAGQAIGLGATAGQNLLDSLSWDTTGPKLAARVVGTGTHVLGPVTLAETKLEVFFGFTEVVLDLTDEAVAADEDLSSSLVKKDGKWTRTDEPVFGVRIATKLAPALNNDALMKNIAPKAKDARAGSTTITLDSVDGLYLGEKKKGVQRAVLPVSMGTETLELREFVFGIVRTGDEVSALEVSMALAAKLGSSVGLYVDGLGVVIVLADETPDSAVFDLPLAPRWPDRIALKVEAGAVKGGGYLERVQRSYGSGESKQEVTEFGGVVQLKLLGPEVTAFGLLTPDPFSMLVIAGVRFPVPFELGLGFTFNAVGVLFALDRTLDSAELVKAMKEGLLDKMLFPSDPVAEAPTVLAKVGKVFPPKKDHVVVGLIAEFGWGSQTTMVEAKLGIAITAPDWRFIMLGALRVRIPDKRVPITDLRCEVFLEVTGEHLLLFATLRDSTLAGVSISGDLAMIIKWSGGGAFALSIGGFHPAYRDIPPELPALDRLTMDLSPPVIAKLIVKVYVALTAGAVMLGARGDLKVDVGVATAHAWLQVDVLFEWAPTFSFSVVLGMGIDIKVFGASFASISFRGRLGGATPWHLEGYAKVDVWWLPTFELEIPRLEWGSRPETATATADLVAEVASALREDSAWRSRMPAGADQLVALNRPEDIVGLVAHPLAVLAVAQVRVPLETHVDRIGRAMVDRHRVRLGLPRTAGGDVGAVSTVRAPFAPGQFLQLDEEALLARAGFEDLPSGVQMTPAALPQHGARERKDVLWKTYIRGMEEPTDGDRFDPRMYAATLLSTSLVGRAIAEQHNPYLAREAAVTAQATGTASILPSGTAQLHRADDGTPVMAGLGALTGSQAAWIAAEATASGAADLVSITLGGLHG